MDNPRELQIDIVVPVFNESRVLIESIYALHRAMSGTFPTTSWQLTIADNASTDSTLEMARHLEGLLCGIRVIHLDEKGRGRALRKAWTTSTAEVVAYLDVDLSTDLRALAVLIAPLLAGHSDMTVGSRLSHGSRVVRGPRRELLSRGYNTLLHMGLGVGFSDAQCGFKAIRREVAVSLLPMVEDEEWFFDTELLVIAERAGLRILDVPIDWVDDVDSTVKIGPTVAADLRGVVRLGIALQRGTIPIEEVYAAHGRLPLTSDRPPSLSVRLLRFTMIGLLSTVTFAALYLVLQTEMTAQAANFFALLVTAMLNLAANRRFTFRVRGAAGRVTHQIQGLAVFIATLAMSTGALAALHTFDPNATALSSLAVVTIANVAGTALRFLTMQLWIFRGPRPQEDVPGRVRELTSRESLLVG